MRRRSSAGGQPVKARRRRAATLKHRNVPKTVRRRSSSAASLHKQVALLTRERDKALDQQTATADVLNVISRSTFDLAKVLNTLLESAARLCEADKGIILRPTGKDRSYSPAASYRHTPEYNEHQKNLTFAPGRSSVTGRVLLEGKSVQIPDVLADPEYTLREIATLGDFRTILGVPLLREGTPIGLLVLHRAAVRPFTEKQIKLVETFTDQAVIAIENVRLFEAEQRRTVELAEALEQQTATSEILRVISSSPTDVQPVLDTIVRTAVTFCASHDAVILLRDGEDLRIAAHHGPMTIDFERAPIGRGWVSGRAVTDRVSVHVHDLTAEGGEFPLGRDIALRLNQRTVLGLPLLREGKAIGCLFLRRTEVLPFSDKQIALLQTFADQAVIAIENVRLFEAEQQRARELAESLNQQTATSEVLQVISSSPGELEPVFGTMLERAVHICEAKFGNIHRWDGQGMQLVATHNLPPAFAEARNRLPFVRPGPENNFGRMVAAKMVIHVADLAADDAYIKRIPTTVAAVEQGGVRTMLFVPMLKEDEIIGAFTLYRQVVRPFTDKQIELVKNFASQAVIAIENTRLLTELRERTDNLTESLEQQTATSEAVRSTSSTICNANFICAPPMAWIGN
jgi:two-component system NtrC family sensor kinase